MEMELELENTLTTPTPTTPYPLPPPTPYHPYLYHNTIKLVHLFLTPNIINCLELSYIM